MQHTNNYLYGLQFMHSAKVLLDTVAAHLSTTQQPMHVFIAFGSTASRPSELYSLAFPATTGVVLTLSTSYCINVLNSLISPNIRFAHPSAHHAVCHQNMIAVIAMLI